MRFERSIIPAFIVGCLILVAGAAGFTVAVNQLKVYLVKEPIPLRMSLTTMPSTLGAWSRKGDDHVFSGAIVEELGTDKYVDRNYVREGEARSPAMAVHIAYYTGTIDDVPHIPDRCNLVHGYLPLCESQPTSITFVANTESSGVSNRATGLEYEQMRVSDPVTGMPTTVVLPVGDYVMSVSEWQDPKNANLRLVAGYFFIANGRITASSAGVRLLAFSRSERYAYYCKVQLSMQRVVQDKSASLIPDFVAQAQDILPHLIPPLMARLPDWPAVERMAANEQEQSH